MYGAYLWVLLHSFGDVIPVGFCVAEPNWFFQQGNSRFTLFIYLGDQNMHVLEEECSD